MYDIGVHEIPRTELEAAPAPDGGLRGGCAMTSGDLAAGGVLSPSVVHTTLRADAFDLPGRNIRPSGRNFVVTPYRPGLTGIAPTTSNLLSLGSGTAQFGVRHCSVWGPAL